MIHRSARAVAEFVRRVRYVLAGLVVVAVPFFPHPAYAAVCPVGLSEDDCKAILGDWPNWVLSNTTCSTEVLTASGKIDGTTKAAIDKLIPTYKKVATATGVPWQLLAAVHYRESNNNPDRDMQAGNTYGGPYIMVSGDYKTYGYPKNLEESATIAAKHLISVEKSGVIKKDIDVPTPDPEEVKDVLYSYNGRAGVYAKQAADLGFNPKTQPYEGSPYVMNDYDQIHQNMKIITRDFGSLDGTDTRNGAFTIYALLGGGNGSAEACGVSANAAGIAQLAMKYAWPDYKDPPYLKMTPEYAAAVKKAQANGEYVGGGINPGIDCGGFVTRVVRDSGADKDYNQYQAGTSMQLKYLEEHPEKWQRIGPKDSTVGLQAGDIAVSRHHTFLFVGETTGHPTFHGNSASASYSESGQGWRSPMASNAQFRDYTGESFIWFRLKG